MGITKNLLIPARYGGLTLFQEAILREKDGFEYRARRVFVVWKNKNTNRLCLTFDYCLGFTKEEDKPFKFDFYTSKYHWYIGINIRDFSTGMLFTRPID